MKIIFWLPDLSMHFSAMIRALGNMGHQVTVVGEQEMHPRRRVMGWFIPDFGAAEVIVAPSMEAIREVVRRSEPAAVHIGLGTRHAYFRKVIANCAHYKRRLSLHIEAPNPDGFKMPLKWMLYTLQRITRGAKADFLMPVGRIGVAWYRACGYPSRRLFPSGYAADFNIEPISAPLAARPEKDYRILFLGQCIVRKRVDLLIKALALQEIRVWKCTIAGDGPEKARCQAGVEQLRLGDRVQFLPSLPNRDALALMRAHDLLVLPSAFDGWGVVVNEALMSGVPVVCSDRCGAADLLAEDWRGSVFRAGSAKSLAQALEKRIRLGTTGLEQRTRIQEWCQCISGRSVAQYILDVLEHVYAQRPRPVPPWFGETYQASGRGQHRPPP